MKKLYIIYKIHNSLSYEIKVIIKEYSNIIYAIAFMVYLRKIIPILDIVAGEAQLKS